MLNWISRLTPEGQLESATRTVETALTELGTQWVYADHETKLACGQLMVDTLRRIIPDYDFSRNIYVQFFDFIRDKQVGILQQGAKQYCETAAAARTQNPALFIVMGSIGQLFSLFAINTGTKRAQTRKATGDLYTNHSRTINDMIQYVLYHRALQNQ